MADLDLSIGAPGAPQVNTEPAEEWGDVDELVAGVESPPVTPDTVRLVLVGIGAAANVLAPDDVPELWRFTDRELDGLTPPLTNIINRTPALRRAVEKGDYAVLAVHLAGYAGRNAGELRKAQRERDPDDGYDGFTILNGEAGGGVDVGGTAARPGAGQPGGPNGSGLPHGPTR